MPALKVGGSRRSCSAPRFVLQEGDTETRDPPARKGEIRVGPGRKRVRQYREIMQMVLMSVRERLAPPFNRVQAEAGPSFRRAPPGASPKGGIIVAQPAAAGRVGLELNSESRRDAASY